MEIVGSVLAFKPEALRATLSKTSAVTLRLGIATKNFTVAFVRKIRSFDIKKKLSDIKKRLSGYTFEFWAILGPSLLEGWSTESKKKYSAKETEDFAEGTKQLGKNGKLENAVDRRTNLSALYEEIMGSKPGPGFDVFVEECFQNARFAASTYQLENIIKHLGANHPEAVKAAKELSELTRNAPKIAPSPFGEIVEVPAKTETTPVVGENFRAGPLRESAKYPGSLEMHLLATVEGKERM